MGFLGLITLVARGDFDLTSCHEPDYACGVRFWGQVLDLIRGCFWLFLDKKESRH